MFGSSASQFSMHQMCFTNKHELHTHIDVLLSKSSSVSLDSKKTTDILIHESADVSGTWTLRGPRSIWKQH